jgi:hypothetical protein
LLLNTCSRSRHSFPTAFLTQLLRSSTPAVVTGKRKPLSFKVRGPAPGGSSASAPSSCIRMSGAVMWGAPSVKREGAAQHCHSSERTWRMAAATAGCWVAGSSRDSTLSLPRKPWSPATPSESPEPSSVTEWRRSAGDTTQKCNHHTCERLVTLVVAGRHRCEQTLKGWSYRHLVNATSRPAL